jgi:nucleoside-diphosphate-sugar epimerase
MWGRAEDFERTNVAGTDAVISACRRHGVRRLVFTSSPSVVHERGDLEGVDESTPYAEAYDADYPRTKAEAERRVLAADGPELSTVALRPHLIWGPGDTHVVPQIVERARSGRLRLIDGGRKLVDTVFVDNAVDAHLLAAERLEPGAACSGRAYFVTNGEPKPLAEIVNRILGAAGEPPVSRSVPRSVALRMAAVVESAYRLLPLSGQPPMTRFIAHSLATAHWYDISAAERDLDYRPRVSLDEGFERLASWFAAQPEVP